MTREIQASTVVADRSLHKFIQAQFGDSIHLIDAESWLNSINSSIKSGHAQVSADVLAVATHGKSDLSEKLQSTASELHLPFQTFERLDEMEVRKWIVDVSLLRAREAWIDAGESRRAAAILRQDLDSQQQAFLVLEKAVLDFGMPQFTLALDLPLAMGGLVLAGDGRAGESQRANEAAGYLTQLLPMSARSIASIELYCEPLADYPSDGKITVSIVDLTGSFLSSSEEVEISALTQGWNRFNFPKGIDCTDRDAMLQLALSGGGAIKLSLGPCMPIERFHPARKDSSAICDAPLAIKVWRGFAGVRTAASFVKISEGSLVRWSAGEMPRPRLHFTDNPKMTFEPVQYWHKEDGFLVHPPTVGMTVALIENCEWENLASVSAIVNNGHRESPTISFAIGIVESGHFFHLPEVLGSWLTLPSMGWGEVHAVLPKPVSGRFDLVIATMVGEGQGNHMAWGLFRGFIFNTHPA